MFALVADVEAYPEFLPWCLDCTIIDKHGKLITADLTIGYKMFRETFTSEVLLNKRAQTIDVRYIEGPFRYLNNHWAFTPVDGGCEIVFSIDFEFRNGILRAIMGAFFSEAVRRMIGAFETRARQLYG